MRTQKGIDRFLVIGFTVLIVVSSFRISHAVAANGGLNLPSTMVLMEASNGTESYFNTKLTNVPSGYDVVNGTYLGWCVDIKTAMARSPATHEIRLFSSSNPPVELANEKWNMVNYILNHKQGEAEDIQQAIWFFISLDGNYTPTTAVAKAIVNDALANGEDFVPGNGQTIAVICYPMILFPEQSTVQVSIIEVTDPLAPEFPAIFIFPLFILLTLLATLVHTTKPRKK